MRRLRRGSCSWACSALLVALAALALAATPAHAATDDQNLTGLVYLADGTPLSVTPWANNTSFAVYVNHSGSWSTAWRYPAWPAWYLTSGGAYSIVLPAGQKDVSWGNGDPYRVSFDASAIAGVPGTVDNATSHGTGDAGKISPVGATDNAIVWNATDNWQRWDVVVLARADVSIASSEVRAAPSTPAVGAVVTINATVRNLGASDAADVAVRFTDGAPPAGTPIGSDVTVPLVAASGLAYAETSWVAGPAGAHRLCVAADPDGRIPEADETNNVGCVDIVVTGAPPMRPDYVPSQPLPLSPVRVGLASPIAFSVQVQNQGNGTAAAVSTLAFYNASTPGTPFATFSVPPLAPTATSARFTTSWTSPATPGTVDVVADVDYGDDLVEWDETNNRYAWTVDVLAGPVTNLAVGAPNVTAGATYVTSATPLSFAVLDQSGMGIRSTMYRVDGGPWINYTATGPFTLACEGPHLVEWYSEDFAGSVEAAASATLVEDCTPPATTAVIGDPKYLVGGTFVNASTPLTLVGTDGGVTPVGVDVTSVRVWNGTWSAWAPYGSPFTLRGADGVRVVEYRSADRLGNQENARNESLVLDDTPPTTTLSPDTGPYTTATTFFLAATDVGSGVNGTEVRIDGGAWTPYAGGFTLAPGDHTVFYRSVDRLGNQEPERTRAIHVEGPPTPLAVNWKPLVAAVFAAILAVAGAWSARRAPWPTGSRRRMRAFVLTGLPFVVAEGATGVVSLVTGLLTIPPLLGIGTAVDVGILAGGLVTVIVRMTRGSLRDGRHP